MSIPDRILLSTGFAIGVFAVDIFEWIEVKLKGKAVIRTAESIQAEFLNDRYKSMKNVDENNNYKGVDDES